MVGALLALEEAPVWEGEGQIPSSCCSGRRDKQTLLVALLQIRTLVAAGFFSIVSQLCLLIIDLRKPIYLQTHRTIHHISTSSPSLSTQGETEQ